MSELPQELRWLGPLAGHGVVVTDPLGRTVWVNEYFTRCTGYSLDEVQGLPPGAVLQCGETDPEARRLLGAAVRSGVKRDPVEILNRTKDGARLWLLVDIVPVRDDRGELAYFYSVQTDVTERRQAEAGWRNRVELLGDLGVLGFWQRDMSSGEGHWDAVCRRIWGLSEDEPTPSLEAAFQRLTPESRSALLAYKNGLDVGAQRGEVAYTLSTKTGRRHVRSLWHCRGNLRTGVMLDLTSQHLLDAANERLLQTLNMAAPAANLVFWRHQIRTGVVHWLPEVSHPLGFDGDQIGDADRAMTCVLPEDRAAVAAARISALERDDVIELEYRARDRSGRVRHLLTRRIGVPGTRDDDAEIIGVVIDVTTQRQRELALRRQDALQRLALRALRAGTFRFDLGRQDFEFDGAMWALYQLTGPVRRLAAEQWLQLVDEADQPRMRDHVARLTRQPDAAEGVRFRVKTADGSMLWLEAERVVEYDGQGRAVALVGTHRDVTAEVAAEEQARKLADAQLVARTRAEFLATLAHELRSPLSVVMGFAQLIQLGHEGQGSGASVENSATHIRNAGEMMLSLLDDLRDLSAADAGVLSCEPGVVDAAALLQEAVTWLRQGYNTSAASRLQIHGTDAVVQVWADPLRTRQILLNLISNALKYSPGVVHLHMLAQGKRVSLAVQDNGPGLTPDEVTRAFQPFERLGRQKTGQLGSGLGLPLCRRLARLMAGDIEVASVPGRGSTFTLVLPAAIRTREAP
jgi:PAS domain S-box-containing protein